MFENYPLLKEITSVKSSTINRGLAISGILGNCEITERENVIHSINGNFSKNRPTIIYMAHYDVVNEKYSNVIDNLASVVNLMEFSWENQRYKDKNLFAIFTNYEETASFDLAGSRIIGDYINAGEFGNVELVVNLELTSIGRHLWVNNYPKISLNGIDHTETNTPFNDAYVINRCGTPAICIGTVDFANLLQVRKYNYCDLWSLCHKDSDLYNKEDMWHFVKETLPTFLDI